MFGPPEQAVSSTTSLNTSSNMIYELISGKNKELPPQGLLLFVDVRDVAKAHVLALKNDSVIGKRVLLSGGPYTLYNVSTSGISSLPMRLSFNVPFVYRLSSLSPRSVQSLNLVFHHWRTLHLRPGLFLELTHPLPRRISVFPLYRMRNACLTPLMHYWI